MLKYVGDLQKKPVTQNAIGMKIDISFTLTARCVVAKFWHSMPVVTSAILCPGTYSTHFCR